MREAFAKQLYNLAKKDKDIIFITGDLGFGVFDEFAKSFPKQYLNVGVAEQNMTGVATGLGLEGKKVFTYSIANFVTLRCLEQIRNDAAYHDINLTIVCSGGGFTYGPLGMSHHATEDIAIMRSIPNIKVIVPSSAWETFYATKQLVLSKGVSYLRIEKGGQNYPPYIGAKFKIGKSIVYKEGTDVTIITAGGIISECLLAAKELDLKKISCKVISMHSVKPLDKKIILECAKKTDLIVSVEEHNCNGGLGGAIAEIISTSGTSCRLAIIAINNKFSSIVGDQLFLRKKYKIDAKNIVKKILSIKRS
jgi:transketolase